MSGQEGFYTLYYNILDNHTCIFPCKNILVDFTDYVGWYSNTIMG